jgi:hypothetical protein
MTVTRKKRPRDPLQLGKLIVEIAAGQVEDREDDGKNPARGDARPRPATPPPATRCQPG